ncbi:MAG: RNA methyltransferase [Acidobacteria bacterium]|nr:RNA methyltransferase [Acidobacteriota bacterium]
MLGAHHPLVKSIRKAVRHGGRTSEGWVVAEGPHLVQEAGDKAREVLGTPAWPGAARIVPDDVFAQISSVEHSQGVLALVDLPESPVEAMLTPNCLLVLLDGVQDPGNAGTILRSAEAFGATGVVFLKGSVNPANPKTVRASAGSIFRMPFATAEFESLNLGCPVFAAMPNAPLAARDAPLGQPCALLIGNEGSGIPAEHLAKATPVSIPTARVESLNAALAAAILLYEAQRQRA